MVQLQSNWSSPSTQMAEWTFLNKKTDGVTPCLKIFQWLSTASKRKLWPRYFMTWLLTLQPQLPPSSLQGSTLQKYQATSSPLTYHMLFHTAKLNMLFPWLEHPPPTLSYSPSRSKLMFNSCVKPFLSPHWWFQPQTFCVLGTNLDNSHTLNLLGYVLMYPTRQDLCLSFVYDQF